MTVQTDVTKRDLVHKTISNPSGLASEDLLQLLIDSIKEYAITTPDPRGHVITWTPAAERADFAVYRLHGRSRLAIPP